MKVLLINPRYKQVYEKVPTVAGKNPPINLACLAAYLREKGIEVSILDAEAEEISLENINNYISKDIDVVGVGAVTPTIHNASKVLEVVKEVNPNCKTIMGGCHITALPKETMEQFPIIDYGILGEGEITTLELLRAIEKNKPLNKIKGLVYRKNNFIKINEPRPLIEDLDSLPFPAYDLLPRDIYTPQAQYISKGVPLKPFTLYFTGRGCPNQCAFCAVKSVWGRKTRFKSIPKIMEEIDILVNKFGIKNLKIEDSTFSFSKQRIMEFNKELRKRNYDLHYNCNTRVDTVDKELLQDMKDSGCYCIRYGVESGSQKILDRMKKGIIVQQIKEAFKTTNEVGITNSANFLIGYPGETWETFNETMKLVKEIKSTYAFFHITLPLVGTELYDYCKKNDLFLHKDFNKWVLTSDKPMIKNENLSPEEIIQMRNLAYKKFYFRPLYILKKLFEIKSWNHLSAYIRGAIGVISVARRKRS